MDAHPRSGARTGSGTATGGMDRRRFLVVAGGAAVSVALAPAELLAARPRRSPVTLQPWELPESVGADPALVARALVAAAVLAPSVCNTQPWRFEVEGGAIRLVGDPSRALSARDPLRREFLVSLGAALENLLVAARRHGYRPIVTYFPGEGAGGAVAEVRLEPGEPRADGGLYEAIASRRTNRRNYEGRPLTTEQRGMLAALVGDGDYGLLWVEGEKRLRAFAELAREAARELAMDRRVAAEFYQWLRFEDEEARATGDGLTMDALRVGGLTRMFARRNFQPGRKQLRHGADALADQAREGIRSASAVCLLVSRVHGDAQRLVGGQVFERVTLKATEMGLAQQPLDAMVQIDRYQSDLRTAFGFRDEEPLVMLRLGHAKPVPPTARRAVALVTSWRTS